jgi:hypothetical protein
MVKIVLFNVGLVPFWSWCAEATCLTRQARCTKTTGNRRRWWEVGWVTPPPLIGGFSQRASGPDPSRIEDIYFT